MTKDPQVLAREMIQHVNFETLKMKQIGIPIKLSETSGEIRMQAPKLGEQGLLLSEIPEKYGGLGTSFIYSATIIEMFSKLHYNSIAANLSVHDIIIAQYIYNYGTEQQKSHYLPKIASGELVGAKIGRAHV